MVDVPLADAPSGVDEDAWEAACAAVRDICGWHVAPSITETVTRDGSGTTFQDLPSLHVDSVTTLVEDGITLDPATYQWSESGQLWRSWPWTGRFRGIVATITHGYEECPREILGLLHEAADRGMAGSAASQVGQVRMGGVSGVPGAAAFVYERADILARHKLPPRP